MEGTLAGHYQIVKPLGGGGFGQTFLAKDSHLPDNPLCVVKQLKPQVDDPATLQVAKRLFDREAETLYQLGNHDQIPLLLAHFEQDGEFYLVQHYIEGQPLDQELSPGKQLSEHWVIGLLKDILQVLSFVHQQKVIHRDIKPANLIRRSQDGKIVLIDFGAVKEVSAQAVNFPGQTSRTVAVGSPGYMPSEQTQGRPRLSSDIYAVGMVGIQALTGVSPNQLPEDRQTGEIIWCDRVQVSDKLAKVLEKMVRYDFSKRYATATEALQDLEQLSNISEETSTVLMPRQPPPSKNLEQPSEQVSLDSPFYIERPPIDSLCYQEILKPGALISIKAPENMGKTWLIKEILAHAARHNYRTVLLNLLQAEEATIADLDKFLRWFCSWVSRRLKLANQVADFWDQSFSSNDNCTAYFEEYLLANLDAPLVLGLENVDRIFQYEEVASNFLGLLRSWYESAKSLEDWQKLRLVLALSTEVDIPLNINQSPFNVGLPIELPEFNEEQVKELARLHELDWNPNKIKQLTAMVGGHPYLVNKALTHMKAYADTTLEELLQQAPTAAGIYHNHLRKHWLTIRQEPELAAALKEVVTAGQAIAINPDLAFKLNSMGLVKKQGNKVEPRCQLYRLYFRDRL